MYQLVLQLYLYGVGIASLFNEKVRKMWRGEWDAFRILKEKVDPNAKYVWFHAASLGEFEQGRPIMERLKELHPEYKILLTFFSPSGYEVRKNYAGADIICYLPLDNFRNSHIFLKLVRPVAAFFIKYEFWYNYYHILNKRGVPVYSVSSIFRDNQIFFRWYGKKYARVLHCVSHYFVQNEKSRDLLKSIGIEGNVTITGDTRFDRVLQIKAQSKQLPIIEAFTAPLNDTLPLGEGRGGAAPKIFVAGSSWQPDEELFIPYYINKEGWKMIIAPHVIKEEHLNQIENMLQGKKVVRYTQATPETAKDADVLIIDCFGLLSSIYRYGDVAMVGGGFGVGIHNVLEAAVWGIPVIIGPNNKRFMEAQALLQCGGCIEVTSAEDFNATADRLSDNEAARNEAGTAAENYVKSNAGATERILSIAKI